ncbi:hypothetical protein B6E66_06875 [Streptomyces maremycinicus]|nr:hypothetical protein B6E66_06875 [Streptomyces sp. B9173]
MHRLLPPSAIAGVSLVCAFGPWVFTEPMVLRGLAAAAAATAILGAYVMRRWDMQAGKQVADLARARASDEWRFEERVAELESDLDESRELRVKLEQRLRSKRTELAGLRNEHAALLRRYATAETERASALEGRRLLEIEAAPTPALPAARAAQDAEPTGVVAVRESDGVEDFEDFEDTDDSADFESAKDAGTAAGGADRGVIEEADDEATAEDSDASGESDESDESDDVVEPVVATGETEESAEGEEEPTGSAVFSPEGSKLFLRAQAALDRFDAPGVKAAGTEDGAEEESARATSADVGAAAVGGDTEAAQEDEAQGKPEAVDEHTRATAPHTIADAGTVSQDRSPQGQAPDAAVDNTPEPEPELELAASEDAAAAAAATVVGARDDRAEAVRPAPPVYSGGTATATGTSTGGTHTTGTRTTGTHTTGTSAPAASGSGALVPRPAGAVQRRPSGHFAVPTAVAVVPAAQPVRRPTAEGGFDFFGTKSASEPHALEAVQNEDLADVVGQEALALHKAESEAEFKPLDEAARGVGQVIDLTAHDETEHIDLQGLRSAVS